MYYIGVDLGTSAVKLVLMEESGKIANIVSKEYPLFFPHPGWSEQNPEDWFAQSLEGIKELTAGIDKTQVAGIGFGGQMHGLVTLDAEDNVIRPAILWNDGRTGEETEYLNTVIGKDKLSEYTANIAFAGFTAPKILWMQKNEPENFKKIEEGEPEYVALWNKFKDLSLKEFEKIYGMLGVSFDSYNGEAFYSDKMDEVVNKLEESGVIGNSEGAKIVDLEDKGLGVCIIKKSDGTSIYATRDLAAIRYRAKTYDFDKCLYVVAYEQNLHFKQVFEVAKHLGISEKCLNGLEHVAYGMVRLTTGRMSTREGTVIKVDELLQEAIDRVEKVIEEKDPLMENKHEEATKIGIGAVIFNNLCSTIIKDQVFDWNIALNFNGETGPYIQYVYVRTKSVLEKAGYIPNIDEIKFELLQDKASQNVITTLYNFENVLMNVVDKNEPSFLARYLIELSQNYSNFYNENKIIDDNKEIQNARVFLSKCVGHVLKIGANLLGIQMPDKM